MKSLIIVLAMASATGTAMSQHTVTIGQVNQNSRSELIFNTPPPGGSRINLDLRLQHGNRMSLGLSALFQLDSLPNLEILLAEVKRTLMLVTDTPYNPLNNKRIDYDKASGNVRIRVTEYLPKANMFSIKGTDQVTQMKVEQDTLRIQFLTKGRPAGVMSHPFFISFYVNNLSDLDKLPFDKINETIAVINKELEPNKKTDRPSSMIRYNAVYDVETGKKLSPLKSQFNYKYRFSSNPYVQSGIQSMRGAFVPSVAIGFELFQKRSEGFERAWRLAWEPLFFFSRDATNKLRMDRNDFITFKQHSQSKFKTATREIEFVQNVSVGYLVRRKGDWLEKNTIKFSLPTGIQYKNILLEPEFVFNDFFRNFSPSLKFTVIFE